MDEWIRDQHQHDRWLHWSTKTNDERIPHVTARHRPPNAVQASKGIACSSQEGGRAISTACLCHCDPGRSGQLGLPVGAPALPVSEARRQTPCMPAWHSWGAHRARWGRGHEAAAGEDKVGPWRMGKFHMVKWVRRGGGEDRQTEIWWRGQTMKKNSKEDWRTGERHGSWFHVREEKSMPEKDRQKGSESSKPWQEFSAPLWNNQEDVRWNLSFFGIYQFNEGVCQKKKRANISERCNFEE